MAKPTLEELLAEYLPEQGNDIPDIIKSFNECFGGTGIPDDLGDILDNYRGTFNSRWEAQEQLIEDWWDQEIVPHEIIDYIDEERVARDMMLDHVWDQEYKVLWRSF